LKFEDLIIEALNIARIELLKDILNLDLDLDAGRLKIILKNRIIIYIRYNNYQQYSYVVQFSLKQFDRIQFDNFDANWAVNSQPHHCHPRFKHDAFESKFTGDPKNDIPILCNLIKNKDIFKII